MLDTKALASATAQIVREHVSEAIAPLAAENQMLLDRIEALEKRQPEKGEPGRDGADGKDGEPGKDGKPGRDGSDGKDGADGRDGADGKPGEKGADGKDGAGIADLMIDRDHSLVATFTDGWIKSLGVVVGRDGADGAPGADGRDGLGFEDMSVKQDGERSFVLRFARGDVSKEFRLTMPVVIDRGVYQSGKQYEQGDAVTWGGSMWIAKEATEAKPDSGEGWRLAVKRGRDGKDAAKS